MSSAVEAPPITIREVIIGVTRGAQVTGVAGASLCLPWLAVVARFFVRIRIQKMFGREDWLTAASMASAPKHWGQSEVVGLVYI
jgi:hypothetical protein